MHPSPASRKLSSTSTVSTICSTAIKHVFASLYNDRAISYRVHKGFIHADVALSAGIQRMVRSDLGASGVMFSLDTESGFDQVVFITAAYGLGETVVQGAVNPDEFYVYKPALKAGRPAILRRSLWAPRLSKMVFSDTREAGRSVRTWTCPKPSGARFSITDADVEELAALRPDHRAALWAPDGHRMGPRRRRRQALYLAGATGDGESQRQAR